MRSVLSGLVGVVSVLSLAGLQARPAAAVELGGVTSATLGWEAASGPVAGYYVAVSRNGEPMIIEQFTVEPAATVSGEVGETLVVQVSAFASDGVTGPASAPSEPLAFTEAVDSAAESGAGGTNPSADATALDFTGDGLSDLLIRGPAFDTLTLWALHGDQVIAITPLAPPDASTTLVGNGDYDGDGRADLLWEDPDKGRLRIWVLDDAARPTVSNVSRESLEAAGEWHVGSSADFDGDGDDDIVVFSRRLGAFEILFMEAARVVSTSRFDGHTGAWTIAAAADLDADGRAEIVWRDLMEERLEIVHIAASGAVQRRAVPEPVAGLRLVGSGDYDGDGSEDLVAQRDASGALEAWLFRSGGLAGIAAISPVPGLGYRARARGDYDGDGLLDVVWSARDEPATRLWLSTDETRLFALSTGVGTWVESGADGSDESGFYARFCNPDVTGDGAVDFRDERRFRACVGKSATKRCAEADLDQDGWVTEIDATQFRRLAEGHACGESR